MSKLLSIVLRAYNEEFGVKETIKNIPLKEIAKLGFDTEIIVVDNNSTDKTAMIARKMGAIVVKEPRQGTGYAIKKGINFSRGEVFLVCDADGAHPVNDIPRLLKHFFVKELDFLTTNRFSSFPAARKATSFPNFFGNIVLSLMFRLLFSSKLVDSQSGMFLFKKGLWDNLKIRSNNYAFIQELKAEVIYYQKFNWAEVNICCYSRVGKSKVKRLKNGLENLVDLIRKRIIR